MPGREHEHPMRAIVAFDARGPLLDLVPWFFRGRVDSFFTLEMMGQLVDAKRYCNVQARL